MLETVTFGVFSQIQRTVFSGVSGARRVWNGYAGLRNVQVENDDLKRQLAQAQIAVQAQRALADRARGLERLLELRDRVTLQTIASEIIGGAASLDFRTVTIDKGTHEGLRADMAVIAPAGIVGRVVAERALTKVLLVDRNAAAALIERSRAQGAVGAGDDRLRLEYVSRRRMWSRVTWSFVGHHGIYQGSSSGSSNGREERPSFKRITIARRGLHGARRGAGRDHSHAGA
jgi:rod shape-determining protein MreC